MISLLKTIIIYFSNTDCVWLDNTRKNTVTILSLTTILFTMGVWLREPKLESGNCHTLMVHLKRYMVVLPPSTDMVPVGHESSPCHSIRHTVTSESFTVFYRRDACLSWVYSASLNTLHVNFRKVYHPLQTGSLLVKSRLSIRKLTSVSMEVNYSLQVYM